MSSDPSPLPAQRTRQILEELRQQGRVVAAELDSDQVANLRTRMPVWEHRRLKG